MLTLTARLSDLELKAQRTQEAKIRLAEQSTEASKEYMDALDAQRLKFNNYSTGPVDATVRSITESGQFRIADSIGRYFKYATEEDVAENSNLELGKWYVMDSNGKINNQKTEEFDQKHAEDTEWLFEQLQLANVFIQKYDVNKDVWEDYSYTSSSIFTTEDDDTNVAQAEAKYEYTMSEIQQKDKRFDLELDNINTEHQAVKTEMDSVKSVINDNVQKSFTIFS
jgi:hypothetical protein